MMDHEKIKEGVRLMLEGIGEDVNREGLLETPDRIARMCEQIYGGLYEDAGVHLSKQFHATNNNIVLEKISPFIPPRTSSAALLRKSSCGLYPGSAAWQV